MQVRVEYAAQVRTAAGIASENVELDEQSTIATLVEAVCARHGENLRSVLCDQSGGVHASILVFAGEDQAAPGHVLRDGETITFLSPISGG